MTEMHFHQMNQIQAVSLRGSDTQAARSWRCCHGGRWGRCGGGGNRERYWYADRGGPGDTQRNGAIVCTGASGTCYHTDHHYGVVCTGSSAQCHPGDIVGTGPAECTAPCVADAQGLGRRVGSALGCSEGEAHRSYLNNRWRDRRWYNGWRKGCEVATARLIIGLIISRNEVILSHSRCSDIETRHLSQRDEN